MIERKKVKSVTSKQFVELGGKKEYFAAYKAMVLAAMKIVKEK